MRPSRSVAAAVALALAASIQSASAVIVGGGGDPARNTTAPSDDFGFSNVGLVFSTTDQVFVSGTYLGNGWVLSAYHGVKDNLGGFSFGEVVFNGVPYSVDAGTAVRLTTPGVGPADLALFRLSGTFPSLPSVSLSASSPNPLATVAMAGDGRNRQAAETHWTVNTATDPDTWTETAGAGTRQGYLWAPGATLRWGMNTRTNDPLADAATIGTTRTFKTTFDDTPFALDDEAQVAPGDSGGGVFFKNGANWELAGIMIAGSVFSGQPDAAVYGNQSVIADIATYRSEIIATIPEPTAAMAMCLGLPLALGFRRFRPWRPS